MQDGVGTVSIQSRNESAWLNSAVKRLSPSQYISDPVGWSRSRVDTHLWSKQREIMRSVAVNRRTAVRSAHATGKSFTAAVTTAWWLDTHPPGEAMVVSTAPSREQVHTILWEEIRKLHRTHKLIGEVQRSDRWLLSDGTIIGLGRKPPENQQSMFQGIHRKYVLVIMDEAGGIGGWLWDAVKTITTGAECRILAIGNPDNNSSEFARVCLQDPTWHSIKISAFDSPNFTEEEVPTHVKEMLVSQEWVQDAKDSWGENSPLYQAKVLGEFVDGDDSLIPLSWVIAANQRWHEWNDHDHKKPGNPVYGVDVGHMGEDKTVIATRYGDVITKLEEWSKQDTVAVTGFVESRLRATGGRAVVDAIGVGAGVVDLLRSRGLQVQPFVASAGTKMKDSSGSQGFRNCRSAAWWNMRERLDPALGATLALPPNDRLAADLTAPLWQAVTGGKIQIESKDDIRKRIKRSTDFGDAVIQAFWEEASADAWLSSIAKICTSCSMPNMLSATNCAYCSAALSLENASTQ